MNKQLFFCLAPSVLVAAAIARPAEAYVWWGAKWPQKNLGDPVYLT
jgi:hypothetical protein